VVINNEQIKLLKTAVRQLGFDDETYREMLKSVAGVRSAKDLNLDQFRGVMEHLESCGFKKNHAGHEFSGFRGALKKWERRVGAHRPGMATARQLARIETDWHLMPWYWSRNGFGNETLALRGFLSSRYGVSDLAFLKFQQAHNAIEALKAIQERKIITAEGTEKICR